MNEHKANAEEFETVADEDDFEPPEDEGESTGPLQQFKQFWSGPGAGLVDDFRGSDRRSIAVQYDRLADWNAAIAQDYLDSPDSMRAMAEKALRVGPGVSANVRVYDLPDERHFHVGRYRTRHLGTLISVTGEVVGIEDVSPLIDHATFRCRDCETFTEVDQEYGSILTPIECPGCGNTNEWKLVRSESRLIDYQPIILFPPDTNVDDPPIAPVYLRRDLVERVGKDDEITVVGKYDILPLSMQKETELDAYIEAHSLEVDENTERGKLTADELRSAIERYVDENESGAGIHGVERSEVVEHIRENEGVRETEIEEMIDEMDGGSILDSGGILMTK